MLIAQSHIPYTYKTNRITTFSEREILSVIKELREVFENHFDRTWFSILIDGLPIEPRTLRDIRELVSRETIYPEDISLIYSGVLELENFIKHVRKFLLPYIKDRLGVSGLFPERMVRDRTQYILRRLVAYTFPYNLEKLAFLTAKLKGYLETFYPALAGGVAS